MKPRILNPTTCFLVFCLLYSCNSTQMEKLKGLNDSLLNRNKMVRNENQELKKEIMGSRDSLTVLQNAITRSQLPKEKVFAFVALNYEEPGYPNSKRGVVVSNVLQYDNLDEEAKYRWMDSFGQSFIHEHYYSNYSITKRQVYTFTNYIDASVKREDVYKNGIGSGKTFDQILKENNYSK